MSRAKAWLRKILGPGTIRLIRQVQERASQILIGAVSPVVLPIMKYMAKTGTGTDRCLKQGFLPVPVHFYQPIPDIQDLAVRRVWDKRSAFQGIRFEPAKYLERMQRLAQSYQQECQWPNHPTTDPKQFHLHNSCFSYGCAATLHCLIRDLKPQRIIEVGSGYSSKVIAAALICNQPEQVQTHYTIVDPYCVLEPQNLPQSTQILKQRVELLDLDLFKSLEANDILFIDSSHVCKIGSDVNFEILEVLPILKPGVWVHFHDINLPFEYPEVYSTNPKFRVFWTESYLLQAFLMFNQDYEIMLPLAYLQHHFMPELIAAFPHSVHTQFGWVSGSFWIRRTGATAI